MIEKYYDPANKRLVFIGNRADSDFWGLHWSQYDVQKAVESVLFNRSILGPTHQYLPKGSRIIDGGCGLGQNVWSLHKDGYDAYGVDYAKNTVEKVNEVLSDLKITCQDIRALKFEDDFFDGYWSIGVIEHFYEGFDAILSEIKRVLRPGGYLFLTFPCMSKFRKIKARNGHYKMWAENSDRLASFYQFALSVEYVCAEFEKNSFEIVANKPISGLKGFKDETTSPSLKKSLQKLYDSSFFLNRAISYGLDLVLSPFTGHCQLVIFKNS